MRNLLKRIEVLESKSSDITPAVKRWLGWPLTDAENAAADADALTFQEIDTTLFSQEDNAWLGVA